ncbi:MAG: excinuclease ABC subunit UvrB [Candidatus Micrarchaeia archaeon]|jgi:excinuclease ABC subunit B
MQEYKLVAPFSLSGDQPEAVDALAKGVKKGGKQTLLGVTGSGKTFAIANLAARTGRTVLVISHNKTLAAQLYAEFRQFFPQNKVGYFVSYYDYYQPESYIPSSDTYIEKDAQINEKIERLRLQSTAYLLSPGPAIIVSTVSCIYGLGSPKEWLDMSVDIRKGETVDRSALLSSLIAIQYERNEIDLKPGIFRAKGDTIDIVPGYQQEIIRVTLDGDKIGKILACEPISCAKLEELPEVRIFPAKHYIVPQSAKERALRNIRTELEARLPELSGVEAYRLKQRTNYDLELIEELGYCKGIENYSRHFDGRMPGKPPYTLMDFLPEDAIIVIDESHVTLPQLHGMYHGDRTRKKNLIDYGFRLPCAYDNRPLKFEEFEAHMKNVVFVSATPAEYERNTSFQIVEQLVRPTGLLDPRISIRKTEGQIEDLMREVQARAARNERTLVTTLTKRMAEDLTDYLTQKGVKVRYLHSEVETIQRTEIIRKLRLGEFDCLVGINLLREGLDIPEVSLVAILDADKEGFLRNETSLVQTMGRAARNVNGFVILYCDKETDSIKRAVAETNRRRSVQEEFNKLHSITPKTIYKQVWASQLAPGADEEEEAGKRAMSDAELRALAINLEAEMQRAAEDLDFERAIELRDQLAELSGKMNRATARRPNKKVAAELRDQSGEPSGKLAKGKKPRARKPKKG